jgi:hypothetical protein
MGPAAGTGNNWREHHLGTTTRGGDKPGKRPRDQPALLNLPSKQHNRQAGSNCTAPAFIPNNQSLCEFKAIITLCGNLVTARAEILLATCVEHKGAFFVGIIRVYAHEP